MVFGSTHPHKKTEEKQIKKIADGLYFLNRPLFLKPDLLKNT